MRNTLFTYRFTAIMSRNRDITCSRDNQLPITVALSQKRASPRYHVQCSHVSRSRNTHAANVSPVARVDNCDQSRYMSLDSHL